MKSLPPIRTKLGSQFEPTIEAILDGADEEKAVA
jgi:hypothetical protein